MTRFNVVWSKIASNMLTELWLDATDRNAIRSASDEIDRELAHNPIDKGTELSEGLWSYPAPPLKVIYSVREDDRIAEVLRVRCS